MTLLKNSLWNIGGYVIPAIVTVPALGIMGRILGAELFGVFTLALAVVGYASIFDAGLTRAVIREISIFRDDQKEKLRIVATATVLILILGMVAGCLLLIFSNAITTLLKISSGLHHEVSIALKILSLSIPLFLITQVWLSILEGMEKFGVLNIYKSITGTLLASRCFYFNTTQFRVCNNGAGCSPFSMLRNSIYTLPNYYYRCRTPVA